MKNFNFAFCFLCSFVVVIQMWQHGSQTKEASKKVCSYKAE